MPEPRVSILIPNFNNGRKSAHDGQRNFIADLIRSLVLTLADDPTPLEIIIADDGSTDDSLATLRKWAGRNWPSGWREGEPILRLLELEHCGVLSVVANRLVDEAVGDILVRLDGDIVIRTEGWAAELCRAFEEGPPDLGVIGPKQLAPDGTIHAAGDWLLHPRGYHHLHQGAPADSVTRSIEVDHVMGCFYCWKRAAWVNVGRFDENILRGQTIDYGVRARLQGWRCFFIPSIEYTHYHSLRVSRANVADTNTGLIDSRQAFHEKWGFDRLAPDLDEVARRFAGTPLLWNAAVFGPRQSGHEVLVADGASSWEQYARDVNRQTAFHARGDLIRQVAAQCATGKRVVEVGCGAGVLTHLLARQGFDCTGLDERAALVNHAEQVTGEHADPETPPAFEVIADWRHLPVEDASADIVTLFDVLERHPNPVGLLAEVHRVLRPGGVLAVLTAERHGEEDSRPNREHKYRTHELVGQVLHTERFTVLSAPQAGQGMLHLVAQALPAIRTECSVTESAPTTRSSPVEDRTRRAAA